MQDAAAVVLLAGSNLPRRPGAGAPHLRRSVAANCGCSPAGDPDAVRNGWAEDDVAMTKPQSSRWPESPSGPAEGEANQLLLIAAIASAPSLKSSLLELLRAG